MLESAAVSPWDMRIWFMSLLVSLGVLVFLGKGHKNFSTWAKKGILSQKASGEWLCWNLLEQLIRGAGFRHGKLHLRWTCLLKLFTPLWAGGKPCEGKRWMFEVDTCWGTSDWGKPFWEEVRVGMFLFPVSCLPVLQLGDVSFCVLSS